LTNWDVSRVKDMHGMFMGATLFNGDLYKWDVSRVTNMDRMFHDAMTFKQTLCGTSWVRSKATKKDMFIGSWGSISKVVCTYSSSSDFSPRTKLDLTNAVDASLKMMPKGDWSEDPNGMMGDWDVTHVADMSRMFFNANSFNTDISKWDVSKVTNMNSMFCDASSFRGDIGKWDVSSVTDMTAMFRNAASFNSDITKWDTSSVRDMDDMFFNAAAFNRDIAKWDVSRVTNMYGMFWSATSFNVDISKWDVSNVMDMDNMFQSAISFKHSLCGKNWVRSRASRRDMFSFSSGSVSKRVCNPILDRELIVHVTKPATTSQCTKCGKFKKSGKVSCCAPGGAWYKNCGSSANSRVDHNWAEGIDACKPTQKETTPKVIVSSTCAKCGTVGKSRRLSCCGRGGSWFRDCGSAGNKKVSHTWFQGIKACKAQNKIKNKAAKRAIGEESADSSDGAVEAIVTTAKKFAFTSGTPITKPVPTSKANPSPKIDMTAPARASAKAPIAASGCGQMCFHIKLLLTIAIALFL